MATKQQIPVLVARLVEFQEEFANLLTEDAQWAIMNGKEAAILCSWAITNRPKNVKRVLPLLSNIISVVTIFPVEKKFVVQDKFKVDIKYTAEVKIFYIGNNFKRWFADKVEKPFIGSIVRGRNLEKISVDGQIIQALDANNKIITSLIEVYTMMKLQPNGEPGNLLNNGLANIFYVFDINGAVRAVGVRWNQIGWYLSARSIGDPPVARGHRIFSSHRLTS